LKYKVYRYLEEARRTGPDENHGPVLKRLPISERPKRQLKLESQTILMNSGKYSAGSIVN
jgi:hypothetical protein